MNETNQAPQSGLTVDFLSKVSHDMRSPLSVVAGAFAEIRGDFNGQLSDEHQRLLNLAERGVARLLRLAEKLSLAARHERGQIDVTKSKLELGPLVRSAVNTQLGLESRRAVEVMVEVQSDGCEMSGDPQKISYTIAEIVGNAVRHARSRVRVSCGSEGDHLFIHVEDDGEGVPPEMRDRIFKRFSTQQNRAGLGLGLALAHDLVAAHGGKISVSDSTLPAGRPNTVGARFTVELPR